MAQQLVLISKEEYELLLSEQKRTPDNIIRQDERASVNQSVNNKQNSTLVESNKNDLRHDEDAPVNESLNNIQKLNDLNEKEKAKAIQESKSVMKGAGKQYVKQSIEQFLTLAGSKYQRKNSKSKGKKSKTKRNSIHHGFDIEYAVFLDGRVLCVNLY